jgi:hypothetical protein
MSIIEEEENIYNEVRNYFKNMLRNSHKYRRVDNYDPEKRSRTWEQKRSERMIREYWDFEKEEWKAFITDKKGRLIFKTKLQPLNK